jgi:hypothetical protein
VWEYYFPFGGPSRWTSGFVQGVAADALERAGQALDDDPLREAARRALLGMGDGLVMPLGGGLWVREYGFTDRAILTAQLQTLLSVADYARRSGDAPAGRLAGRLETAARSLLPRFDAGCWSLYSLGGHKASRHYQGYHVALLRQLASARPPGGLWSTYADRFGGELRGTAPACP